MMVIKLIRFILALVFISIIILPLLLFAFSISDITRVDAVRNPTHYDLARVKEILQQHDPRQLRQGQTGSLSLSEQDINTVLITSLSALGKARAKTRLYNDRVVIDLSFKLPENSYAKYSNLSLSLKNTAQGLLTIEHINFGTLSIPGWLVNPVWNLLHEYFKRYNEYHRLTDAVQMIYINQRQLSFVYKADWEAIKQLKQRGQEFLLSENEQKRIRLYQHKLFQINNELRQKYTKGKHYKKRISLSEVLQPMFQLALKRSSQVQKLTDQPVIKTTAIAENKALLFVLAMYAAGKNIDVILGQSVANQSIHRYNMVKPSLRNRVDLMQHFSVSAFLAAATGDALALATGLFKEVSDAKGGSGFSFADLAADRAGVQFGTIAVASESSAQFLQRKMSIIIDEDDYMPDINNLPEGLHQASFKRRFGTTESARYKKMQHELDRRIGLCRLYKQ